MRKPFLALALACAALAILGCERNGTQPGTQSRAAAPSPSAAGEGHAADAVVPGSYDDWCAEHQVPETQCTRCDASLIPAFQALGDWDPDHGLPKSQCLVCDPSLKISRPPKPEGS